MTDIPRRDYLQAVVSAYLSIPGHQNPSRANACDGGCSVDDVLAVGNVVVSKG
jgi:hypothetical protein